MAKVSQRVLMTWASSALLFSCSTGGGLDPDALGSNGDVQVASMGNSRPEDGILSFSYALVWNQSDEPVTLVDATLKDTFGGIVELDSPRIADEERISYTVGSYPGFPYGDGSFIPVEAFHDLAGYVMEPMESDDVRPSHEESTEIIVGVEVAEDDMPAGAMGVCVRFRNDDGDEGEKCIDHQWVVCEDYTDCPIGPELEERIAAEP